MYHYSPPSHTYITPHPLFLFFNQKMKRKWEHPREEKYSNYPADIELHLETPLPLEWQRCLDIQSGQIHFYNTKTQKRTSVDPRRKLLMEGADPNYSNHGGDLLSLNLELNLNCQSNSIGNGGESKIKKSDDGVRLEREEQEMVARVCMQCHLLVMLLKSSPTCPNCKFIHSFDPTTNLFIASHPTTTNSNNNQAQSLNGFPNPIQNQV